jgi:nucleotide-binding universal stress UspA family protein
MVPVDGSPFSEQALPTAISLAEASGAQVHIVHVHQLPLGDVMTPGGAQLDGMVDRELRNVEIRRLSTLAEEWSRSRGSVVRAFSLDGLVVDALTDHADKYGVDMIVMTTHGRGGLSRAWLGSVADRLVRTVRAPVLLRRPHSATGSQGSTRSVAGSSSMPAHMLIPLDGSRLAETIIDEAAGIARLSRASFTLLKVVPPPIHTSNSAALDLQMAVDASRQDADDYLNECAHTLRARGFDVRTRVMLQSNVAAAIVEEATESGCDMIAMATHGRSGFSRLALGSVADKVLRSATIPLLVMKPDVVYSRTIGNTRSSDVASR